LTFDFSQNDRLLLNYNLNYSNNDVAVQSNGIYSGLSYTREDETKSLGLRHEASATYQKRFSGSDRKLDFKFTYVKRDNDFKQENLFLNQIPTNQLVLDNSSDARTAEFRVDFSQPLNLFDKGKISIGGLYDRRYFTTKNSGITNLDYQRQTASSYVELQTTIGKLDFILGTRAEDYDISGTTYNSTTHQYDDLHKFKQYRLFPNASAQYNFMKEVNFAVNYNKKISLPSISVLNPNSNIYRNSNYQMIGNANLQPTIYDNIEAEISAFDYIFLGYNLSLGDNHVEQKMTRSGDEVSLSYENISSVKIHNFNIGFPIPFMIFTKPIKEIKNTINTINTGEVSYLYFYTNYQFQRLPYINPNGRWFFNLNAQIVLPKGIKLNANYSYTPANAGIYYYKIDEPMNNAMDITLSRKFMKDRLNVSLYVYDVFNTNKMVLRSIYQASNVLTSDKSDTRTFGISVNYKIPTRNKLAKENPNMLSRDSKED
jgi:tonB-dependent outer membrane receptorprecursor